MLLKHVLDLQRIGAYVYKKGRYIAGPALIELLDCPEMQKKRLPKSMSRPRTEEEFQLLKRIGEKTYRDLTKKGRPVEWLAFEAEIARSTVRRIFDGDGNIGIITLHRIAHALGYEDVFEFLKEL